ncbi:5-(carboxyamino)imidazole ribonucleotide synthase [Bacillus sp. E214]|uniref:5-(carboxyamino)imidazole ribonucleotide synthase n=1 Tax=Bacillus sp. E214 TaxID=2587156 RepID=UPI0011E069A3|nr:5-(carboxyamino)imidazole ribonucleotide synthase [Bacillus sp. E214]
MNLSKQAPVILPGQTIGIIGGGQLGRMLALAARNLGFKIAVLDPTPNSPCGQIADMEITAPFNDVEALQRLAKISDVLTFEFENIDADALDQLTGNPYIPQGTDILRITQDRVLEKQAIEKSGVKVGPFEVIASFEDLRQAISKLGYPSVLKTARGGYDGKGQLVIRDKGDLAKGSELLSHGVCVLESFIPFQKEISVIVTRKLDGSIRVFPVAENIHVNNILHQSIVPARINENTQIHAIGSAVQLAESLQVVGTLAVEMFLLDQDDILVNELAPRPHNSGHFSIEACETSQFEQHIRAVCNWPLGHTELHSSAVMVNVLGQHLEPVIKALGNEPDWKVHIYGKREAKKDRKMGHITVLGEHPMEILEMLNQSNIWTEQTGDKKEKVDMK